jgi:hypothetical protein
MDGCDDECKTIKNNELLYQLLNREVEATKMSRNDISRKERTAYYEQEATRNLMNFHAATNYAYWFCVASLLVLFIIKKKITLKRTKKNLINISIIVGLAIYPHIMGYVYEAVIKIIEYLWAQLPKNVYTTDLS